MQLGSGHNLVSGIELNRVSETGKTRLQQDFPPAGRSIFRDILVPQFRLFSDKARHQRDAAGIIGN